MLVGPFQEYLIRVSVHPTHEPSNGPVGVQITLERVPFFLPEDIIAANLADYVEFGTSKPVPAFYYALNVFAALADNRDGALGTKDGTLGVPDPLASNIVVVRPGGRDRRRKAPQDRNGH